MRNDPSAPAQGAPSVPDAAAGEADDAACPPASGTQAERHAANACDRLACALAQYGLQTTRVGPGLLLVTNPLTTYAPTSTPALADARLAGFRQLIACLPAPEDLGSLWFWWVWAVAEDDSPAEVQPLCPASATAVAAERIVRLLAVREDRPSPRR